MLRMRVMRFQNSFRELNLTTKMCQNMSRRQFGLKFKRKSTRSLRYSKPRRSGGMMVVLIMWLDLHGKEPRKVAVMFWILFFLLLLFAL